MAHITCHVFSEVLNIQTSIQVILPQPDDNTPFPVLYLLHGYSDDETTWTRRTSIERYAEEHGIAVVMPRMDHSYYTDMMYGKKYWTFLTEELPSIVHAYFPLTTKREETFVAGLSMGGYGALKWALSEPESFKAVATLSGVTDLASYVKEVRETGSDKFDLIFGNRTIARTADDPLWLLKQVDSFDGSKPAIYQSCGTEDFLFHHNLTFKEQVEKTSIEYTSEFGPGDHEWGYWDEQIQHVLTWLSSMR
ncbi:alpha/beta hydrolase [Pontibacillus yanchengensis]|uniref:Esterase n=1 Tax=Pontibacillus yanchengensis Y32 TaxID=1385514 RepID=A0A0A2TY23_9BACI|nr:alpha/beta hydrolase family protein [Pontibacillus yanchengensis]KGP74175.1 esterase [Pontibacillus yanchengensis Y32]